MEALIPTHGFWVGFFFSINSIIGAGILAVPWAFQEGGMVLGIGLMLFAGVLALVLSLQMLEIMSRTEAWVRRTEGGKKSDSLEEVELLQGTNEEPTISERKFDMTEMFNLFYGERTKKAYMVVFALTIYSTCVAYCTIFATSLTEFVPVLGYTCHVYDDGLSGGCRVTYSLYLLVFCGLMMFFCCRGYEEQVSMQVAMASLRFLVIGLILVTVIIDIATHKHNEGGSHNDLERPKLWEPLLAGIVFSILFLAISFHNTIPNMAQMIVLKQKNLPKIMVCAVAVCTGLFLAVGILVPFAVDDVSKMASLDWRDYSAGHTSKPWWAYFVIVPVVLFPALDVISVFPIYNIALSDNLIALKYGHSYEGKLSRGEFWMYRCLAILPPFLIALLGC